MYKRDIYGPTWTSISIPASDTPVHIKTGAPADVYVKLGTESDPNEFNFDFQFIGQSKLTLDPANFPSLEAGYAIAIYQKAYDEPRNTFLADELKVKHQTMASLTTYFKYTINFIQNIF